MVERASGEHRPTQEPTMNISTIQLVEKVDGGVSPT